MIHIKSKENNISHRYVPFISNDDNVWIDFVVRLNCVHVY